MSHLLDGIPRPIHHPSMFLVYEVLLYLVFILTLPWFLVAGFFRKKYFRNFGERLGIYRTVTRRHDLWIHAVSVGEVNVARSIVAALLERRPDIRLLVTTTTITGQSIALRAFPTAQVTYFPFDFSLSIKRFLLHHAPRVFVTVETEIWPNAARLASRGGIGLALVNGRISDRSYPRYSMVRFFLGPVLRFYDAILVREQVDYDRVVRLGASPERVTVAGNVKFDYQPPPVSTELDATLTALAAGRPIFVLGSTVAGEDEQLIPHLASFISSTGSFLVLAPRKPERFEIVAAMLSAAGIDFVRRSEPATVAGPKQLLLLDTIGELAAVYGRARGAFVGGSLVPAGGHNPIEPAAAGTPVAFGPSMTNFREIASTFLKAGGAGEVASADELFTFFRTLLGSEEVRNGMAARALETVERNRGAAARTADTLVRLLA